MYKERKKGNSKEKNEKRKKSSLIKMKSLDIDIDKRRISPDAGFLDEAISDLE